MTRTATDRQETADFTDVPEELKSRHQWVNWVWAERVDKATGEITYTKEPVRPGLPKRFASSTTPATWATFAACVASAPPHDGIGFVFSKEDGFFGVDLDNCRDPKTGEIDQWAMDWIDMFSTYTEVSPSLTGVKLIGWGKLSTDKGCKRPHVGPNGRMCAVERYDHGRFFTITGRVVPGCPLEIRDCNDDALRALEAAYPKPDKEGREIETRPVQPVSLDDAALLDLARRSRSGSDFADLYDRGVWRGGKDHSGADLALCNRLAFWTGRDATRMDRLFRASALMRDKWEREDYRASTMGLAIRGCRDPYTAPRAKTERASVPSTNGITPTPAIIADADEDEMSPSPPAKKVQSVSSSGAKMGTEWAAAVKHRLLFSDGDQWMEYRNNHWRGVSASTVMTQMVRWLETERSRKVHSPSYQLLSEIRKTACFRLGAEDRPMPRDRFDCNSDLLPMRNGMLDLKTRVLKEHSPSYLNTYCLPYDYDPKATCPRFSLFLEEVLLTEDGDPCREWIDQLHEWSGYCLIPSYRAETILVNVGEGGNGKSQYEKVLTGLVGADQCVAIDLKQLSGNHAEYELASVFGKLVGFISEPNPKHLSDCLEALKKISSGDSIKARQPGEKAFDYIPYARLMINCNEMPGTNDPTQAMGRRLLFINWRRANSKANDRTLQDQLLAELPGILNLALDGLDRLRARRWQFVETDASAAMKQEHRKSEDTVAQYLEAACEADPARTDIWSVPTPLYDAYANWARRAGYHPVNISKFGTHLTKRLGFPPARAKKLPGGRVVDVRYGIRHLGAYEQQIAFGGDE